MNNLRIYSAILRLLDNYRLIPLSHIEETKFRTQLAELLEV